MWHPAMDRGEFHEAKEAGGGLVVSGGDAAKQAQKAHHALDAIAPGKAAMIERARGFAVGLPWDDGARAAQMQLCAQAVGVMAFVGEKLARRGLAKREQVRRGGDVGGLAGRQVQGERQAVRVRQDMDLGRELAAGSAQGIKMLVAFPAPALSWRPRITGLSIIWIVGLPAPLAASAAMISS
jgi:hypothetical protein